MKFLTFLCTFLLGITAMLAGFGLSLDAFKDYFYPKPIWIQWAGPLHENARYPTADDIEQEENAAAA